MINIYLKKLTTTRLSAEFQGSRKCIKAKKQHSKELGHGNRPNVSDPVEFSDEEKLIEHGAMRMDNHYETILYCGLIYFYYYYSDLFFQQQPE
jgi:hypothetical protein